MATMSDSEGRELANLGQEIEALAKVSYQIRDMLDPGTPELAALHDKSDVALSGILQDRIGQLVEIRQVLDISLQQIQLLREAL